MNDLISRQAEIKALKELPTWWADEGGYYGGAQPPMVALLDPEDAVSAIDAQPERDIPIKPIGTTDTAWGIPIRQAVCPKCDYYLGHVNFIGDSKRITYCETCGQAIDWEGWEQE